MLYSDVCVSLQFVTSALPMIKFGCFCIGILSGQSIWFGKYSFMRRMVTGKLSEKKCLCYCLSFLVTLALLMVVRVDSHSFEKLLALMLLSIVM